MTPGFWNQGIFLPWEVATDSNKARIREVLLSPPVGPYVAVLGDGQKHAAIYAEPGHGPVDPCVYFRPVGKNLHYDVASLAAQIRAVEQLCAAGAEDVEILSGNYARAGRDLPRTLRIAEPVIRPVRGGAMLELCLYLRRPRPVLLEDPDLVVNP
jgi:hypothetical protein